MGNGLLGLLPVPEVSGVITPGLGTMAEKQRHSQAQVPEHCPPAAPRVRGVQPQPGPFCSRSWRLAPSVAGSGLNGVSSTGMSSHPENRCPRGLGPREGWQDGGKGEWSLRKNQRPTEPNVSANHS